METSKKAASSFLALLLTLVIFFAISVPGYAQTTALELMNGSLFDLNHEAKTISKVTPETKYEDFITHFTTEKIAVKDKSGTQLAQGELIGTGMTVSILDDTDAEVDKYTIVVLGDVTGDGKVTAADARTTLKASSEIETLGGVYFIAANVLKTSILTATGARKILRATTGLTTL